MLVPAKFIKRYRKYSGYQVHGSKFRVSYFALLIPACQMAGGFEFVGKYVFFIGYEV